MDLGDRIRQKRQEMGLSQTDLAIRLGIRADAMWRYEHGLKPGPDRLYDIARELDVSMEWLLKGDRRRRMPSPPEGDRVIDDVVREGGE